MTKKKTLFCILIGLVISLIIEGFYNYGNLTAKQPYIDVLEEKEVIINESGTQIVYSSEIPRYVDKLSYCYDFEGLESGEFFNAEVSIVYENPFGGDDTKTITDNNPYMLRQSVVSIHEKIKNITINISGDYAGASISEVSLISKPTFNLRRWLFWFDLIALLLLLFVGREYFANKIEKTFLLLGILAGTLSVVLMPMCRVGLDEEAHFRNSYRIMLSPYVDSSVPIENLMTNDLDSNPFQVSQSSDEWNLIAKYYENEGDYRKGSASYVKGETKITTVAAYEYIFMALGIKFGKMFHFPFAYVYMMGRLFNMWSYVLLIYFALKKLPYGKHIMAGMALMPTPMIQASGYSYDSVVTGFIFLGIAYLMSELSQPEKKLSIKVGTLILFSLGFGILPKPVYIPLMFLPFLIKKEKFANEKQRRIFRSGNIVCVLGLILGIVAPILFNPGGIEDSRGGNVNAVEQLKLILEHPFSYLKVWMQNVSRTFWSYTFGEDAFGTMGHMGTSTCVTAISMFLVFLILTDNQQENGWVLSIKQKIVLAVALFFSVAFVWGSMYLVFNEVAVTYIGGVQGRYFIALLFLLYILIRPSKVINKLDSKTYNSLFAVFAAYIIYKSMYDIMLVPHCF